jgi:hypothetical protein
VQATAPGQLPNSFDRIQFGTVGRQVIQSKIIGVFFSPLLMKPGVMVLGVVGDHNHSAAGSDASAPETFHESKEGRSVELV